MLESTKNQRIMFVVILLSSLFGCTLYESNSELNGVYIRREISDSSTVFVLPVYAISFEKQGVLRYTGRYDGDSPVPQDEAGNSLFLLSKEGSWQLENDTVKLLFPTIEKSEWLEYRLDTTLLPLENNSYSNSRFVQYLECDSVIIK